jgi:hypothetical protein
MCLEDRVSVLGIVPLIQILLEQLAEIAISSADSLAFGIEPK